MKTIFNNKEGGFIRYLSLFLVFIVIVTTFSIDVADVVESEPVQFAWNAIKRAWSDYWQPWISFVWNGVFVPTWNWISGFLPASSGEEGSDIATSTLLTNN